MTALLALALLAGPGLSFDGVSAWKWSDGRKGWIPALSAMADNQSGIDYEQAYLRVRVDCLSGGSRTYEVVVHDLLAGRQPVAATAFDAIDSVEYCDGPASVELVRGRAYESERRPAYAILGFSYSQDDGPASRDLEGILDYRRRSDAQQETIALFWKEHGRRIELDAMPGASFYCFRIEPGTLGLAGFLLNRDRQSTGPLSRFLRFYDVAPGQAAYLGVFHVSRGPGLLASVTIEEAPEAAQALAVRFPRPVVAVRSRKPGTSSGFVVGR